MSFVLALLLTTTVTGETPQRNTALAVQRIAMEAGQIIGAARHCRMDPVDIEDFYVAAEARINALADGPADRVRARIRLDNTATVKEARGPEDGCDAFRDVFNKRFTVLR